MNRMEPMGKGRRPSGGPADRVVAELRALSTTMDRLDQFGAQRFGLNRTDFRALDLIGQRDGISPTALARALGLSTGATTTVLDRLERTGHAVREPDPADRRRSIVRMTEQAERQSDATFGPIVRDTVRDAAAESPELLTAIADFLARHRETLLAHLDETD